MTVTEQLVPPGVWASDGLHSSVRFEVGHMGVSMFSAGFVDVDARLLSSPGGLELRGRVGVASFDVHDDAMRPPGVFGAVWVQAELRKVLRTIGARVVEHELAIATAHEAFDPAGRLLYRSDHDALSEIVRELVREAEQRPSGLAA